MAFQPSKYQSDIFNWSMTANPGNNLVVEALAGSGKTTTLEKLLQIINNDNVLFVAFNKSIATELQYRMPKAQVRTYHALGLNILTSSVGRVNVQADRNNYALKNHMGDYWKFLFSPIKKLVSMVKNNLTDDSDNTLLDLAYYYGIAEVLNGDKDQIFSEVRYLLNFAKNHPNQIDFDDMIWLPHVLGLRGKVYDWILVDELQDTNRAQSELISLVANDQSNVIGVGDRHQSIYAFRGANSDAIPEFINRWNAQTLPLSITYRNPKSIVKLVQSRFPNIHLECPDSAIDGNIEALSMAQAIQRMDEGDMILCRVNADLVKPVFELIRMGKKAIIRGRDIGQNLISLIYKLKANDLPELITKATEFRRIEMEKLLLADKNQAAQALDDKVETLLALTEGVNDIRELIMRIEAIFSDNREAITFSSIHRAKGLEADNVYLLRGDLLPHPLAKSAWEREQESNLEYVAYTRTKKNLYLVV